jgi:hypothetical protein
MRMLRNPRCTIMNTVDRSHSANSTTSAAAWRSSPWKAWKRRKRLCFSTTATTTENTRPMQHGT